MLLSMGRAEMREEQLLSSRSFSSVGEQTHKRTRQHAGTTAENEQNAGGGRLALTGRLRKNFPKEVIFDFVLKDVIIY